MAKHMIHSLGSSKSFGMLSLKAKVLWPMIIAEADDQGRFDAEPCAVKWSICQNVEEIQMDEIPPLLAEMVEQGMLHLYGENNEYGQIINWWPHQQMSYARPSKYPPPKGWADRIHYRQAGQNDTWVNDNWEGSGGFGGWAEDKKDKPLPSPSDTLDEPLPTPSDKARQQKAIEGNINRRQGNSKQPLAAASEQSYIINLKRGLLKDIKVNNPARKQFAEDPRVTTEGITSLYDDICRRPGIVDVQAVFVSEMREEPR